MWYSDPVKKEEIIIYTDGSSIGNPGPGGWGAIVSVNGWVREFGGKEKHTTNNRMELLSSIEALKHVFNETGEITVYTDSQYLINGVTKWVHGWKKNGWKTGAKEDVLNKDLWEELDALNEELKTEWQYAPGHAGVPGNERVDEIAQGFARGEKVTLFEGDGDVYSVDLNPKARIAPSSGRGKSAGSRGKAYSYLSLVNGKVERHATWAECEKRVKGKAGVKFKKTFSAANEGDILGEWGVKI